MIELTDRLVRVGLRVLKTTDRLCNCTFQSKMPKASQNLFVDPMMQLSTLLAPHCDWHVSIETMEKQQGDGDESISPFVTPPLWQSGLSFNNAIEQGQGEKVTHSVFDSYGTEHYGHPINQEIKDNQNDKPANAFLDSQSPIRTPVNRGGSSMPVLLAMMFPTLASIFRPLAALNILPGSKVTSEISSAMTNNISPVSNSSSIATGLSQPTSPGIVRMVQGASHIAAVLRDNIRTDEVTEPAFLSPVSKESSTASTTERKKITGPRNEKNQSTLDSRLDLEEFLDKFADQLEFDLVRMYGTSGR